MPDVAERLCQELGATQVAVDPQSRAARRRDRWVRSLLEDVEGRPVALPACVVRPRTTLEVAAALRVCRELRAPVIPYGLGSGVCGGVLAGESSVVLDLGGMTATRELDDVDLLATFEAGLRGSSAETLVAAQGMTLGHYPQSIDVSSVGGWVATRSAGQFSTGYGNVEDVVMGLEVVLPERSVLATRRTPRASSGPDLRALFIGSEGTLGVVTAVTFALRRQPELRTGSAWYVADMGSGFELQRRIVQAGYRPVVMRLYDAAEATRHFAAQARGSDALLLLVHEGPEPLVGAERGAVAALAAELRAEPAPVEAVDVWLAHRNEVPRVESLLEAGLVVDTIEVAATWRAIGSVYRETLGALAGVDGLLLASAHSSHCYRSGLSLYFTFAAKPPAPGGAAATYDECWRRVMEATLACGGGVAHHHGIGRVRRPWVERELGLGGASALRTLKRAFDPDGLMNPGVLLAP